MGERQRGRERIPSRLQAVSSKLNAGLDLGGKWSGHRGGGFGCPSPSHKPTAGNECLDSSAFQTSAGIWVSRERLGASQLLPTEPVILALGCLDPGGGGGTGVERRWPWHFSLHSSWDMAPTLPLQPIKKRAHCSGNPGNEVPPPPTGSCEIAWGPCGDLERTADKGP